MLELLYLLNGIRSAILIVFIVGLFVRKYVHPHVALGVAVVLLILNLTGLAISIFLVDHG